MSMRQPYTGQEVPLPEHIKTGKRRKDSIEKQKVPYRASQSLIAASCDSSYDTRKNEMGARSNEEYWQEMIGKE